VRDLGGCDRSIGATWRRECESSSMEEVVDVGKRRLNDCCEAGSEAGGVAGAGKVSA
jgi:hypothetical protein